MTKKHDNTKCAPVERRVRLNKYKYLAKYGLTEKDLEGIPVEVINKLELPPLPRSSMVEHPTHNRLVSGSSPVVVHHKKTKEN